MWNSKGNQTSCNFVCEVQLRGTEVEDSYEQSTNWHKNQLDQDKLYRNLIGWLEHTRIKSNRLLNCSYHQFQSQNFWERERARCMCTSIWLGCLFLNSYPLLLFFFFFFFSLTCLTWYSLVLGPTNQKLIKHGTHQPMVTYYSLIMRLQNYDLCVCMSWKKEEGEKLSLVKGAWKFKFPRGIIILVFNNSMLDNEGMQVRPS